MFGCYKTETCGFEVLVSLSGAFSRFVGFVLVLTLACLRLGLFVLMLGYGLGGLHQVCYSGGGRVVFGFVESGFV